MQIFKYAATEFIDLPEDAEILHVGVQNNQIYLWAAVDVDKPTVRRQFKVVGTGWDYNPDGMKYLGTAHVGPFVWHVFEDIDYVE